MIHRESQPSKIMDYLIFIYSAQHEYTLTSSVWHYFSKHYWGSCESRKMKYPIRVCGHPVLRPSQNPTFRKMHLHLSRLRVTSEAFLHILEPHDKLLVAMTYTWQHHIGPHISQHVRPTKRGHMAGPLVFTTNGLGSDFLSPKVAALL